MLVWDVTSFLNEKISDPTTFDRRICREPKQTLDLFPEYEENTFSMQNWCLTSHLSGDDDSIVGVSSSGWVVVVDCNNQEWSVLCSWRVSTLRLHCVTVLKSGLIVLGYGSGVVEGWHLYQLPHGRDPRKSSGADASVCKQELMWRTFMEEGPCIRACVELRAPGEPGEGGNAEVNSTKEYILMTIQRDKRSSTVSMVEVIDVASLEARWEALETRTERSTLHMEPSLVLPSQGREIVNTLNYSKETNCIDSPQRVHWNVFPRSDGLVASADGSVVTATVADGSVLVVKATNENGQFGWGIQRAQDQMLLSHPTVGVGVVHREESGETTTYSACCLLGGTVYLVPTSGANGRISVLSYGHDIDQDSGYDRLHSFASGNLVGVQEYSGSSIPVVIFAWQMGIMDVYSCELLTKTSVEELIVLRQLVADGTIAKVVELVKGKGPDDEYTKDIHYELDQFENSDNLSVTDLLSPKLNLFREYILGLG